MPARGPGRGARPNRDEAAAFEATDAPGFTLHDELALLVELGLSPAEAVAAATSKPARFLGLDHVGTIEGGQTADLVMLSANPLDDIRNTRAIRAVVSNGEFLDRAAPDSILAESRRSRSASPGARAVLKSTGPWPKFGRSR